MTRQPRSTQGDPKRAEHRVQRQRRQRLYNPKAITWELAQVAEKQNINKLLQVIDTQLKGMNGINLATAMHRVAKLASSEGTDVLDATIKDPAFKRLLDTIRRQVESQSLRVQSGPGFSSRPAPPGKVQNGEMPVSCMSVVSWACATMRLREQSLFAHMAYLAAPELDQVKTFELSNMLWAYAKLELASVELLRSAVERLLRRREGEFTVQCLSTIAWSFATGRFNSPHLMSSIAKELKEHPSDMKPQEIANTLWALAKCPCDCAGLFEVLGRTVASQGTIWMFKAQELSSTLWAFATARLKCPAFFELAEVAAVQRKSEMSPQNISNILWAFAKLRARPHPSFAPSMLSETTPQFERHKAQEISAMIWAAARLCPRHVQFFIQVASHCRKRLHEFAPHALANMAKDFVTVGHPSIAHFIGQIIDESARQMQHLRPFDLSSLMRTIMEARSRRSLAEGLAQHEESILAIIHQASWIPEASTGYGHRRSARSRRANVASVDDRPADDGPQSGSKSRMQQHSGSPTTSAGGESCSEGTDEEDGSWSENGDGADTQKDSNKCNHFEHGGDGNLRYCEQTTTSGSLQPVSSPMLLEPAFISTGLSSCTNYFPKPKPLVGMPWTIPTPSHSLAPSFVADTTFTCPTDLNSQCAQFSTPSATSPLLAKDPDGNAPYSTILLALNDLLDDKASGQNEEDDASDNELNLPDPDTLVTNLLDEADWYTKA